jgi:2-oxoglutarate ferredoxin oxidoreductase subunit alpha
MRLRALPINEEYARFVEKYPRIYVVENNFDAQMAKILTTEAPKLAGKITPIAHNDGLPLTGRWIAQAIVEQER